MLNFQDAKFARAYGTLEQLKPSEKAEICFSGRSNVGKSSLINKVLGRKSLARVSTKPGKTVTINFYDAGGIHLVDLPGYGYAKVPFGEKTRWSELMEGYFHAERDIRLVFQLIDMRHAPTDFDLSMLDFLFAMHIPYCIVLTKCDKLNKTEFSDRLAAFPSELGKYAKYADMIPFSAANGTGREQIIEKIEKCLGEIAL